MTGRLEELREKIVGVSLQSFVDTLNEKGDPIIYATALRYHRDRRPSAAYLANVASVFRVRLEWLVNGSSPVREEPPDPADDPAHAKDSADDVLSDIVIAYGDRAEWITHDPAIRDQLLRCQRRKDAGYREHVAMLTDRETVGVEVGLQVSLAIGRALRAAVDALDVDPNTLSPGAREDLVVAFAQMVIAVENAPPGPAKVRSGRAIVRLETDE